MPFSVGVTDLEHCLVVFDVTPQIDYSNDQVHFTPTINIATTIGDMYSPFYTANVVWQGEPITDEVEAKQFAFEHLTTKLKNILT